MEMDIFFLFTIIHFLSLAGLSLYGLHRAWMMACWLTLPRAQTPAAAEKTPPCPMPLVTVQVPLYNEPRVAARIIDAVASLDWPKDRLEIQILDDSTDATRRIAAERAAWWSGKSASIAVLHRTDRAGYKAGALARGLETATGEYIAVFDADFVPEPDFLKKIMPYFNRPDIGMVQARWEFLNAEASWLTRLQALLLSAHFGIEHAVRCGRGLFFNFNGTAGVWRKSAILASGGWQSDTVTEDLDISYRAQMAGWRFVYAHEVSVPSELPVTLSNFRTQQERWSKGSIQTARKLLPQLLAADAPVRIKTEAAAHLMANCCWVFCFIATITLYPTLIHRMGIGVYQILWLDLPLFLMTGVTIPAFYAVYGRRMKHYRLLWALPLLPAASIGLAPFFSLAVFRGLFQKGGVFQRTPKFGYSDNKPIRRLPNGGDEPISPQLLFNLLLFLYTLAPVGFAWSRETWPAVPFLCLFPTGFALVILRDLYETVINRKFFSIKPKNDISR